MLEQVKRCGERRLLRYRVNQVVIRGGICHRCFVLGVIRGFREATTR